MGKLVYILLQLLEAVKINCYYYYYQKYIDFV